MSFSIQNALAFTPEWWLLLWAGFERVRRTRPAWWG